MDAELISAYQKIPSEGFVDWDDLPATREFFVRMHHESTAGTPDSENVVKEDRSVPGPEGASEVPVRVYRPIGSSGALPGVLWIHGGGYVYGSVETASQSAPGR
jgi:acetyl esterase/lipase